MIPREARQCDSEPPPTAAASTYPTHGWHELALGSLATSTRASPPCLTGPKVGQPTPGPLDMLVSLSGMFFLFLFASMGIFRSHFLWKPSSLTYVPVKGRYRRSSSMLTSSTWQSFMSCTRLIRVCLPTNLETENQAGFARCWASSRQHGGTCCCVHRFSCPFWQVNILFLDKFQRPWDFTLPLLGNAKATPRSGQWPWGGGD